MTMLQSSSLNIYHYYGYQRAKVLLSLIYESSGGGGGSFLHNTVGKGHARSRDPSFLPAPIFTAADAETPTFYLLLTLASANGSLAPRPSPQKGIRPEIRVALK